MVEPESLTIGFPVLFCADTLAPGTRKYIYIPALFFLKGIMGSSGLAWAQPVADLVSTAMVVFLYLRVIRKERAA